MAQNSDDIDAYKASIRQIIWEELRKVAKPDSRFHYDFSSFIPDFEGSGDALNHLRCQNVWKNATCVFIAPDNCLRALREAALWEGKEVVVTTYGIRRGFWALDPAQISRNDYKYASTLDGLEETGKFLPLDELAICSPENEGKHYKIDLMVTGTGAVSTSGVRFGKGHGYFDLEWGILYSIGCIALGTTVVTVAADCQVVDIELRGHVFDTACDYIATPTKLIDVPLVEKPNVGILWEVLQPGMLDSIPTLKELRDRQWRERPARSTDFRGCDLEKNKKQT